MKLPNADGAVVDLAKVTDYLLNASHPDNGGKAQFFVSLGLGEAAALIDALRRVAVAGEVVVQSESPHGLKFVVDGTIQSPSGRQSTVRTVWIIDAGEARPRLITAYPGGA